tara:strand:- start:37300 stop:39162 length:1863 start_codon:yes stop_codon:yes gene_type:complete
MAYKFQLGTFQSPGDIKLVGGADLSGSADVEVANDVVLNNDGVVYFNGDGGSVKISSNGSNDLVLMGANQVVNGTALKPQSDAGTDLGASGAEFKDLYIDGVAYIDSLQADQLGAALDANSQAITNINVDSGAIDGTTVGASSQAAGKFTTLSGSGALSVAGNIVPGVGSDIIPDADGQTSLGSAAKSIKEAHISGSNSKAGKDVVISDHMSLGYFETDHGDTYYAMLNSGQGGSDATPLLISASAGIEIHSHDVADDYQGFTVWGTDMSFYESGGSTAASASITREGSISGSNFYLDTTGELRVGSSARLNVSGNVFLPDNSITNDNLAGSIANAKLANSSITLTQGAGMAALGAVSLGGSVTVAVDGVLEDLDTLGAPSADGEFIVATGAGAFAYESGATARTSLGLGTSDSPTFAGLTINGNMSASGNFYVAGTITSVNTDELVIKDKTVTIGSGSSSKANAAGSAIRMPYAADNSDYFEWVYLTNGTGDASASGDIFVARDESGNLIDIQAANIYGTVTGDIVANVQGIGDAAGTLQVGFNYGTTTLTANRTWTLPASPTIGQVVNVKAPSSLGGFKIVVDHAGTQTIDGEDSVDIVSDDGAVNLMYVASDKWSIY